jgi:hypothetical protein
MIDREWKTTDKTSWGPGPWQDEPDKKQWTDTETGLPCLIKRNTGGALCGYVGVPEGHPWHGKGYGEVEPYADRCMEEGDEAETICHIPEPGEPDNVWWLGFDCAHLGDLSPAYKRLWADAGIPTPPRETYKPVAYVESECGSLAQQAIAALTVTA